jgi:hypothetical protein
MIQIEINCLRCNIQFETSMIIEDGSISNFCCCMECYQEYYSKENIRDRKLNSILE